MEPIELSLFASRLQAICEEMGTALRRTAFSPNIRDRLDFSCAVFDTKGRLSAQAAHIPVHLGSMAFAMSGIVECLDPAPGGMVIRSLPGRDAPPGRHLIAPLFHGTEHCGFVVNRAHHADIGCATPGGMPIATRLEEEGLVIAPQRLRHVRDHRVPGHSIRRQSGILFRRCARRVLERASRCRTRFGMETEEIPCCSNPATGHQRITSVRRT